MGEKSLLTLLDFFLQGENIVMVVERGSRGNLATLHL